MDVHLAGQNVLIVEDQYFIADDLRKLVLDLGARVIGPYASLEEASVALEDAQVDIALLDINLAGEMVYPVAEELRRRKIPFIFVTGYSNSAIRPEFASTPQIEKPWVRDDLARTIASLVRIDRHKLT